MVIAFVANITPGQSKGTASNEFTAVMPATAAGQTVFLAFACDNLSASTPTVVSIATPAGETASWTLIAQENSASATAAGGVMTFLYALTLTVNNPGGWVAQVTLSGAVAAKAWLGAVFTGVGELRSAVAAGSFTAASLALANASAGNLIIGAAGDQTNAALVGDTDTTAGNWSTAQTANTTGGGAAANISALMQWKILTSNAAQSFGTGSASAATGLIIASFAEAATGPGSYTLAGVGSASTLATAAIPGIMHNLAAVGAANSTGTAAAAVTGPTVLLAAVGAAEASGIADVRVGPILAATGDAEATGTVAATLSGGAPEEVTLAAVGEAEAVATFWLPWGRRTENSAETGLADGTNISTANSDDGAAGTALVTVTGATGSLQYSTLNPHGGSLSHREIIPATTGNVYLRHGFAGNPTMSFRVYFLIESHALTGNHQLMRILSALTGMMGGLRLSNTLVPQFLNGGAGVQGPAASAPLELETWYRFEAWVTPGPSSLEGRIGMALYLGDEVEPFYSFFSNAANLSTTSSPRTQEWGRAGAVVGAITVRLDDWANDDSIGEAFIGPVGGWGAVVALRASGEAEATGSPTLRVRPPSGVRLRNTMETGLADGTTATSANSADGTAGDAMLVSIGAGATATYESAAAIKGAQGIRLSTPVAINNYIRLGTSTGPITNPTLAARYYFRVLQYPSAATNLAQITNAATTNVYGHRLNTTGTFAALSAAGTQVGTPSIPLTIGAVYRAETWVTPGTSTGTGRVLIELYAGDDTATPLFSWTSLATNANTSPPRYVSLGRFSTGTGAIVEFDDFAIDDAIGEDFIGPSVAVEYFTLAAVGSADSAGSAATSTLAPPVSLAAVGSAATLGTADVRVGQKLAAVGAGATTGTVAALVAHKLAAVGSAATIATAATGLVGPTVTLAVIGSASTAGTVAAKVAHKLAAVSAANTSGTAVVGVAHKLAAVGSASTTGTAAVGTVAPPSGLSAMGSATTTGTVVALVAHKLAAVGSASTTGTAAATVLRTAAAVGSASTTGTAALRVGVRLAAVGSAATLGTAAAGAFRTAAAVGSASSTGTAAMLVTHKLAAVGSASTTGTAAMVDGRTAAAVGSASSTGTMTGKVAHKLAAVGDASTTGTVVTKTTFFLAVVGSASTTATVISGILGVTSATGSATSTGTVALKVTHKLAAVGSASAGGTAAARVGLRLAGVGSASTAGTVVAVVRHKMSAVGAANTTGTAAVKVGVRLTADGVIITQASFASGAFTILAAFGSATTSATVVTSMVPRQFTLRAAGSATSLATLTAPLFTVYVAVLAAAMSEGSASMRVTTGGLIPIFIGDLPVLNVYVGEVPGAAAYLGEVRVF